MLLNARKVTELGLAYVGVYGRKADQMTEVFREEVFQWHYGSSPLVIANIWYDLQQGKYHGASLSAKDNSPISFKLYMTAHFFLWVYPKNAGLTAGATSLRAQLEG